MSKEHIVRYTAEEIRQMIAEGHDKTDWARVNALTDEEILQSIQDDPDWVGFLHVDWSKAKIVYPIAKSAISIRLDNDIIDFFKEGGKGYQSRINAVLRHFMIEQQHKKKTG